MKNIGIDVQPPKRSCNDPLCPFHGFLKVRGRVFKGKAVSVKAQKTIVVEREYLEYVKRFLRYEKRRSMIHAHLPPCISISEGDLVNIGECRPVAKTVSFVVLEKVST